MANNQIIKAWVRVFALSVLLLNIVGYARSLRNLRTIRNPNYMDNFKDPVIGIVTLPLS